MGYIPMATPPRPLTAYYCQETNPRTGNPCRMVLVEAWSSTGALVRRRCKQCGHWALIEIAADANFADNTAEKLSFAHVLD